MARGDYSSNAAVGALPTYRRMSRYGVPMILAVDAGNTRIKWGVHANGAWQATGACATADAAALADRWRTLPVPHEIVVANVAGDRVQAAISVACERFCRV